MATSLCGSVGYENTGQVLCDIERGNPIMMVVGSGSFSPSDYASQSSMDAKIIEKLKLANGNSQKLYPFPVIQGTTDQTEAAKYGTLGYGLRFKLVRSKPSYEFDVLAGSSLEKRLMSFDGETVPLYILDDKSQLAGVKDVGNNFIGSQWQVGVEPRPYGDAQNPKSTKITISLVDSRDFVENAFFHTTALATSQITGLKDVNLTYLSKATNVYKIKMLLPTAKLNGDLDIYDDYGALIQPLTFTAFTGANFTTPLTITSVAVDAALKALTVTFDSTMFTALPALAQIKLVGPIPSVLDAANVTGIELISVILTK